ncbi:uncharacterized protein PEZ65_012574 [Lycodopsis pacificus]
MKSFNINQCERKLLGYFQKQVTSAAPSFLFQKLDLFSRRSLCSEEEKLKRSPASVLQEALFFSLHSSGIYRDRKHSTRTPSIQSAMPQRYEDDEDEDEDEEDDEDVGLDSGMFVWRAP